jgi:RNA recognition motif-containing protein
MMTLYVGSLASPEDGREVARLFSAHGKVVYAQVVEDPYHLRSDGYGIVQMSTMKEAQDVIAAMNNSEFRGRRLTVRGATAVEESAAGHPRMYESMNMADDTEDSL